MMTLSVPKLVLIILLILVVWYISRLINRGVSVLERRHRGTAAAPHGRNAIEDLVSCRACGAYVSPGARGCGRPTCPRPH
jgi:hypothetical protein